VRRLTIPALALLVAGCTGTGGGSPVIPEPTMPTMPATTMGGGMLWQDDMEVPETIAEGTFSATAPGAITYDRRIVPEGATAQVAVGRVADGISVRLAMTGMLPRRTYGAHLHTRPCTATPADAGPHYQHNPAPQASASAPAPASAPASASASASALSADPAYANPANEVWLDFTADRLGAATVTAVLQWQFDELTPPRSLVVHLSRTRTEPGLAGTAGDRVACLTLPG
jgi:Cu-Zn family superoxide dismutase